MFLRLALALAAPSLAIAAPQDPFEPNDTCGAAAAAVLTPRNLTVIDTVDLGPDDDFFAFTPAPGATLVASAVDANGNALVLDLYDAGCNLLASGTVACAANAVIVGVSATTNAVAPATSYTLYVSEEDAFEPNDSRTAAAGIVNFSTPELIVSPCSEDWWQYRVLGNGYELQVDVVASESNGDLALELYDVTGTMMLDSSATLGSNRETVRYTNNSTMPEVVTIRVFDQSPGADRFSRYMLTACFNGPTVPNYPFIGTQVCESQVNSTGDPATLCVVGSNDQAQGPYVVNLGVFDLLQNSFGYFIADMGTAYVVNPGTVMGNLCLAAPGRYSFAIQNSMSTSNVFYSPNPNMTPVAGGAFTQIMPGQTWYWQYWYRDVIGGMATSNFSSAVCVEFQ